MFRLFKRDSIHKTLYTKTLIGFLCVLLLFQLAGWVLVYRIHQWIVFISLENHSAQTAKHSVLVYTHSEWAQQNNPSEIQVRDTWYDVISIHYQGNRVYVQAAPDTFESYILSQCAVLTGKTDSQHAAQQIPIQKLFSLIYIHNTPEEHLILPIQNRRFVHYTHEISESNSTGIFLPPEWVTL